MLIDSKWHEYYDSVQSFGIDKTCVYKREQSTIKTQRDNTFRSRQIVLPDKKLLIVENPPAAESSGTYYIEKPIIGFCGHLYPVVLIRKGDTQIGCYSLAAVNAYFAKEKIEIKDARSYWSWNRDFSVKSDKALNRFFEEKIWANLVEIFAAFRVPCFIYGVGSNDSLILNPNLTDLDFMKVKDPQTAFQELYMFLSGVLGVQPEKPKPVDDKIMAAARGHDGKYSFRKVPGKRGKNRWR